METLGLSHFSTLELLGLVGFVSIAGVVVGYATDMIMGDRGFGPLGNGALAVLGAVVGAHYRAFVFGPALMHDTVALLLSAACAATAMLLTLGVVKHWVQS